MNIELNNPETVLVEQPIQYAFVLDADLTYVGGGSTVTLDY